MIFPFLINYKKANKLRSICMPLPKLIIRKSSIQRNFEFFKALFSHIKRALVSFEILLFYITINIKNNVATDEIVNKFLKLKLVIIISIISLKRHCRQYFLFSSFLFLRIVIISMPT